MERLPSARPELLMEWAAPGKLGGGPGSGPTPQAAGSIAFMTHTASKNGSSPVSAALRYGCAQIKNKIK